MTLTLQDSIDRFQANEGLLDAFVNDPAGAGQYHTREGRAVPTVPQLVEEVRLAASALGAADGAANVGYTPAAGEPTDVEAALRALEAKPAPEEAIQAHEQQPDPHPGYAMKNHSHSQYMTLAQAHAVALSF